VYPGGGAFGDQSEYGRTVVAGRVPDGGDTRFGVYVEPGCTPVPPAGGGTYPVGGGM
jgi:hypothetical protein